MLISTCGRWPLKIGVLIFGILEIIRYIYLFTCAVIDYTNLTKNNTGDGNSTEYIYNSHLIEDPALLYFYVPASIIMLVFSCLMIFGSHKEQYKYIIPHFYAHLFLLISLIMNYLYNIVVEFAYYKDNMSGLVLIAKLSLSLLYDGYFCLLVFSRIKELKTLKNVIYPVVS